MSILKLRDDGKLSLDDPAERYVPELKGLKYPTTDSPRITIRHLLSHSEGFPGGQPVGRSAARRHRRAVVADAAWRHSVLERARASRTSTRTWASPSSGASSSNVSGMPYTEYVAANVLRPLGMTSTTLEPSAVPPQRLAHGYRWEEAQWKDEPLLANGSFGSMGGMLTSVQRSEPLRRRVPGGVAAARWT